MVIRHRARVAAERISRLPGVPCHPGTMPAVAALLLIVSLAGVTPASGPLHLGEVGLESPQGRQSWLDPTNVSGSPAVDSEAPALVVTGVGSAHIVWEEGDALYHAYQAAGSWSAPAPVATGEQPSLAVTPAGTVHLVFVNEIDDVYNLYYTRWDGDDWAQPPRKISDTGPFSDSPQLAAAADGHLHVVWTEDEQVYYGNSSDGLVWAYAPIAEGSAPTIGVDGAGAVQAAWQGEEGADYDVCFSRLEGYSWLPPLNVSDSSDDSTAPDLFVKSDGTPHLAWQEVISATPRIRYSHGPGWTQTVTLSESGSGAYLPSLTIDAWGRRHAAWEDFAFPTYRIRHTSSGAGDPIWSPPATLAQGSSLAQQLREVSLYPGSDGTVHVAWVESEGGKGEVFYLRSRLYPIYLPLLANQVGA